MGGKCEGVYSQKRINCDVLFLHIIREAISTLQGGLEGFFFM